MCMYAVMEDGYKENNGIETHFAMEKRPQNFLALDTVMQTRINALLSHSPTWLEEKNQGTGPGG